MSVIAFILFIIAAVLFGVNSFPSRVDARPYGFVIVPLGLFFLTVGFIVQFCSNSRTVHF